MQCLAADLLDEQVTGQMDHAAVARRRIRVFALLLAQHVGQLADRLGAACRHHHDQRHARDIGDALEAVHRIVADLLAVERRRHGHSRGAEQDGVAIGFGVGDQGGADIAGGARLVLDDQLLAQELGEPRRQQAGENVGRPAGCEGDHHANGPVGVVGLRQGAARHWQRSKAGKRAATADPGHGFLPLPLL